MKVQIDLPEIPGYEYTGEYRVPVIGDLLLLGSGKVSISDGTESYKYLIIRKLEPKAVYRPFKDYEEMKPHRERWVKYIDCIATTPLWWTYNKEQGFEYVFNNYIFEDTGEPVGIREAEGAKE